MNKHFVVVCGLVSVLMAGLCPAQEITVKSGDSIAFMGDSISDLLKTAESGT